MIPTKRGPTNDDRRIVNPANRKMIFTDLNIDCLEEILERLSFIDLLQVVNTCKRLQKAAGLVFITKYGKDFVEIEGDNISLGEDNELKIRGMFSSHHFLKCFGNCISKVRITFDFASQNKCKQLFSYVNKYCSQNLISLDVDVDNSGHIFIDNISKPFEKVKDLTLNSCTLGSNLTNFNKWFPRMENLNLYKSKVADPKCFEAQFPHLTHFHYDNYLKGDSLGVFIRSNPQMVLVHLGHVDVKFVQKMSKYWQNLQSLTLEYPQPSNEHISICKTSFKNVRSFHLNLNSPSAIQEESLLFDNLNIVCFVGVRFGNLFNFVKNNSKITSLSLTENDCNESDLSAENVLQVAKALPSLSQLFAYSQNGYSLDQAIRFLDEVKPLEYFDFIKNSTFDGSDLEKRLGEDWRLIVEFGNCIVLKKKSILCIYN